MRKIAFFLAIVVVSINGFSQKTFVDPHLRQIQHCKFFQKKEKLKRNTKDNRFSHIKTTYNIDLAEDDPKVDILFEFNGNISELERNNIKINTKIGNIYTSKIPLSKIDVLENIMGVKEIELGRPLEPEMDVSRPYIGLDQAHATFPYRGNGVVIGVIDGKLDYTNKAFLNSSGTNSRIHALWAQNMQGIPPSGFNYGAYYNKPSIFSGNINMIDELGHGTHVLGIAAGNGKDASGAQTDFGGVAPEATIVYVSLNYKDPEGSAFVDGTSVTVIDAIKFISDQAKSLNMPWVANLSSGALYGPRNGTSLYERAIAEIANDNSFGEGRILVTSAGNGHQNLSHEYYNAGKNNHENVTYNAMLNFHIQPDDPTVINSATIEVYIPTGVTVDEFFL